MRHWDFYDHYFPPSRPREAKGGIRSQSKHGAFAQSWWAKRWIAILEGFNIGSRLQRGRSYARGGQVLSIDIGKGEITAQVQGSRPMPYEIKLNVKKLSDESWSRIAETASSQAVFASKLLAGDMPGNIEDLFREAGESLFPQRHQDLKTGCSCPDSSNPCKHIAAVYYLLGEEFDRDPFLIFKMRGMSREEFLALLGENTPRETLRVLPLEPLPADPLMFWKLGSVPEDLAGSVPPTAAGAALPRRLGKFPFWRGTRDLFEFLDQAYNLTHPGATESAPGPARTRERF